MLETVKLQDRLSRSDYRRVVPALQRRLHHLQRACHEAQIGSLVVFEGWLASGVGTTIRKLSERLEPRALNVVQALPPRTHELPLPWLWRFWMRVPGWGAMSLFDRSWYRATLEDRASQSLDDPRWLQRIHDINSFERALFDDRYEVIKIFFHISPEEQRQRFEKHTGDPLNAWRITDADWERLEQRPQFEQQLENVLAATETEWAPWTLIAATDKRWRRWRVFELLVQRMEAALIRRGFDTPEYLNIDPLETWESEDLP